MSTFAGDPTANGNWANNDPFFAPSHADLLFRYMPVTPFSLLMVNLHVYAGPVLYQAGLRTTSPSANCVESVGRTDYAGGSHMEARQK
jgi:hypothetical protein